MESTKDLLERSKELKKNIRAGLNKNKSVLTQSRESRAIRQAKLKKIKDEMGLNLLPLAPSFISKGKSLIKKGLSSSEKDELDNLKNKSDLDDDELQRFSELQEKNSNDFEDMDEMRNNLQEMTNQVKQNRIDLRQNDEDINDDPKPQRTEPEESNDGIEDAGNDLDKVSDDDILESTANKLSEGEKIGSDVGKIGEDVGKVGEELGGEVVAGGGEIDPIQDIIGGLIAVGGAIGSAVSVEKEKERPTAMPVIQQQQTLEGTQV